MAKGIFEALAGFGFFNNNGNIGLKLKNKTINFFVDSGTVVGLRHDSEIEISGGGGSIQTDGMGRTTGYTNPITSWTTKYTNFFIKNEHNGYETSYTLTNTDVPFREGQRVKMVSANAGKNNLIISVVNHSTGYYYILFDQTKIKIYLGLGSKMGMISNILKGLLVVYLGIPLLSGAIMHYILKDIPSSILGWIICASFIAAPVYFIYEFIRLNSGKKKLYEKITQLNKTLFKF